MNKITNISRHLKNSCLLTHYVSTKDSNKLPLQVSYKKPIHCFSSSTRNEIASYEDVKKVTENPKSPVLLIDVREPEELAETGCLPNSVNIPLGTLLNVLQSTSEDEFLRKYGKPKPNTKQQIITSCRLGKRSAEAQKICLQLGYQNTQNYLGGWNDWKGKQSSN